MFQKIYTKYIDWKFRDVATVEEGVVPLKISFTEGTNFDDEFAEHKKRMRNFTSEFNKLIKELLKEKTDIWDINAQLKRMKKEELSDTDRIQRKAFDSGLSNLAPGMNNPPY